MTIPNIRSLDRGTNESFLWFFSANPTAKILWLETHVQHAIGLFVGSVWNEIYKKSDISTKRHMRIEKRKTPVTSNDYTGWFIGIILAYYKPYITGVV